MNQTAIAEFEPAEGLLLCEQQIEDEKVGLIVIPDSVRVPLTQGVVLKAGEGCKPVYAPGRIIVFRMHTEDKVTIGGIAYLVIDPANVILTGPMLPQVKLK